MLAGSRLLLPVSINFITLVPKPGRKEGHAVREPSLLRGIAVLRRSGSRKWQRPPVERGTRCRLPSTGGAIAVHQEAEGHRAVHQRGPVPSHGTASEPLSWLRTEWQCVREPDREFIFFSLPSLVSVTPHPSVSFSLASSVLTPRYAAAALTGSPRGRGEGGSRAQSREYPPACEGRWGYVTSGAGPRAVGTERGRWSECYFVIKVC